MVFLFKMSIVETENCKQGNFKQTRQHSIKNTFTDHFQCDI